MPGKSFPSAFPAFGSGRGFPGLHGRDWGGIKDRLAVKSSGFPLGRPLWALTVTVLAGGAQSPRLLASALALVQRHPAGAASGLSPVALFPALLSHVTPLMADITEEKTMTAFDIALLLNALAHVFNGLATLLSAPHRRRKSRR